MSYEVYYESSNGEKFNLLDFEGVRIKDACFHDFNWDPQYIERNFGGIITEFKRQPKQYSIVFNFRGSLKDRKEKIEKFHFCTEWDITHMQPGKIVWGDDYALGFFTAHKTEPVDTGNEYTQNTATFTNFYPAWIEEKVITIHPNEQIPGELDINKGFPAERTIPLSYPYEYSYSMGENATYIQIDHYSTNNFKLIVYGPAQDVEVTIAGHLYKVNYPLLSNQYMVIDSRPTTDPGDRCYLVKADGEVINTFDYRDPRSDIFTPIPPGNFVINYPREYGIELTIFIERSEPRCASLYS